MYLKLALRNARRSAGDYLLYIMTMTILIAIMEISNFIAITGKMEAGFQTASLPLLIALILVVLAGYINSFMLKQRAKEFANYLLLGMEKKKLSWMFAGEVLLIGLMCLVLGCLIGSGVYWCIHSFLFSAIGAPVIHPLLYLQSLMGTFLCFCVVELFTLFMINSMIISKSP